MEKKCIIVKEKLFNHRELNNLAFKKGFEIVRQKGDHGILKHKKTNKTVVITQGRMLGKGLSESGNIIVYSSDKISSLK